MRPARQGKPADSDTATNLVNIDIIGAVNGTDSPRRDEISTLCPSRSDKNPIFLTNLSDILGSTDIYILCLVQLN